MAIAFKQIPRRGDIVVNELATRKQFFIHRESFDAAEIVGQYEAIDVVAGLLGGKAVTAHKTNGTSNQWCIRIWWYLSGYTLDGAAHSGSIGARFASNEYASNISKSITYSATSMTQLCNQLNTIFTSDTDFAAQDWYADVYEDKIRVACDNVDWRQPYYNTASGCFTLGDCMPEIESYANMRRKHGGNGGEGAISSMARALIYYRNDNGADSYMGGRTSVQTSVKQTYPINLPTWLGTSTKNPGDYCAALRAIYGEGEEGWLRFMKSCLPVVPTDFGNMGMYDGQKRTKFLASIKGRSAKDSTIRQWVTAAATCYNIESDTISKGDFWLGATNEISVILSGTCDDNDPLNLGLEAIGGTKIYNSAGLWACLRCDAGRAWCAYGVNGFFGSYGLYYSLRAVPTRSIPIAQH